MRTRSRKTASIAFTGAAATLVGGLAATPAMAASSWHVKNGGAGYHGPTTIRGTGGIRLSTATIACKALTGTDSVPSSRPTGTSPVLEKILTLSGKSCSIFAWKLAKAMNFHAHAYDASTGTTVGDFGKAGSSRAIEFTITGIGNNCRATVTGSELPASYRNGSHAFIVDPGHIQTLVVKSAVSCGLFHTGDKAFFSGKLIISPALTFSRS